MVRIGDQLVPLVAGDPNRKIIRVKNWAADHGENLTRARVHGDDRAVPARESLLCRNLQIDIDRQLELLARNRRGLVQSSHFPAMAVHQGAARSVLAHEHSVVLPLYARHTDHVAGAVKFELRLVQHILGHFPDVPDQVRHEPVARIQTPVRHDGVQFRQLVAVSIDKGERR